jgi:hypothetical protein
MRMTIAAHVQTLLGQLEKVRPMSDDERNRTDEKLRCYFRAVQRHAELFAPFCHETQTVAIDKYFKSLQPTDILDDDSGPSAPF